MSDSNLEWQLSAFIDDELPPFEHARVAEQVANDSQVQSHVAGLRDVDRLLRAQLGRPNLDVEQFLQRLESAPHKSHVKPTPVVATWPPSRFLLGMAIVVAASVLLAFGFMPRIQQRSEESISPATSVAQIVRFVGNIEFKPSTDAEWETWTEHEPRSLESGSAIRTSSASLCEITTPHDGTLRINQESEIVLHRSNDVELIRGEFWYQTGANEFKIRAPNPVPSTVPSVIPQLFVCPQDSRVQCWLERQTLHCGAVSNRELTLRLSDQSQCTLEAGQWIAITSGLTASERGQFDPVHATAWQLPLLLQRSTDDAELQGLLVAMLAQLGRSKMQHLYENQIRNLGPTGAVPLVAFVKSPRSLVEPELRHQAMRIVADLAPESTRGDLSDLAHDRDATVAQYAKHALARLGQ